ncbi:MAG: hypothetical protein HY707_04060 [Ignavibacteriae bacterium]|nr:hypothetical protein [Ignavibacteriota bacterium]
MHNPPIHDKIAFGETFSNRESERKRLSGNIASRIKQSLVSKEIIDITPQRMEFIDPLFKLWFSTVYMKQ